MNAIVTDLDIDNRIDYGWKRLGHYKNAHTPILFMCPNGHQVSIRWEHYKNGVRCGVCYGRKKYTNADIDRQLESGWKRIGEYKHSQAQLLLECPNGHKIFMKWGNYQQGKRCIICFKEKNKKENHHSWNPLLSAEDRERLSRKNNDYKEWRKKVFIRDAYRCQICGCNKKLNAHHYENFSENKGARYDLENGVTMCNSCHANFHKVYGRKGNNKRQYLEYEKHFRTF
jgi:hypothetical protein